MKNYKPKPCATCGVVFKPTTPRSKYCGNPECRRVAQKVYRLESNRLEKDNARRSWRYHNDPEYRARVLARFKERNRQRYHTDPEYRAKRIEAGRAVYGTPEYRARMAEYRERTREKQLQWVRDCRARKAAAEVAAVGAELQRRNDR